MWEQNKKLWPPEKMSRKPQQIKQKPCNEVGSLTVQGF